MDQQFDVAVIGGGPAGMMAAGRAAELGAKVVLIEKNPDLGRKLRITGGGRCNITNAEFDVHKLVERYGAKGKALHSCFSAFNAQTTFDFFQGKGLQLKIEAEKRAFPASEKADDVWKVMTAYLKHTGVTVQYDSPVMALETHDGKITGVRTKNRTVTAKNYIITTGGKSHPETGSTGDGFQWLKTIGHTVVEPKAALVPVAIKEKWVADLMGLSFGKAKLTIFLDGKRTEHRSGKLLFTHFGISGPLALNMSKRIGQLLEEGEVTLSLDLYPALDGGSMDRCMLEVFEKHKNRQIKNAMIDLCPPKMGPLLLTMAGINPDMHIYRLPKEERKKLGMLLKGLTMTVTGLLGEDKAIITSGGVALNEVDFATMRSKKFPNLFFAGDILDFDRPSGGFSLQICWSTGWIAGTSAAR